MKVIEELQRLSDARFQTIYESLQQQGYGPLDSEVAKSLNHRLQTIRNLPMALRAKRARSLLVARKNSELAYELLGSYLIKEHKELVTRFLDLTGVQHTEGMVEDLESNAPDASKIDAAVAELDKAFPPDDVTLYLAMCADQWAQVSEFEKLWRKRAGIA